MSISKQIFCLLKSFLLTFNAEKDDDNYIYNLVRDTLEGTITGHGII